MNKIIEFFEVLWSITIALCRLFFLICALVTSGVQIILFTGTEICNIEMKGAPLRYQRRKLEEQISFVDRVCLQNPDLLDYAEEHPDHTNPEDTDDGEDYGV